MKKRRHHGTIEQQLKQELKRLHALSEGIDEIIYVVNPDTYEIIFANKKTKEVFGAKILGKKCYETFQNLDHPCSFCTNKLLFRKRLEKAYTRGVQNRRNKRWYRCMDKAIKWPGGKYVRFGIAIDVTEQKKTEEALRESEERYRILFEESPISLWEEDFSEVKKYLNSLRESGVDDLRTHLKSHHEAVAEAANLVKILDVNKATLELYKAKSKEDLLSRGLSLVLIPESYRKFIEELAAIAEGKTRFECEVISRTLTGEKVHIALTWSVVPGYEKSLSRVLVSKIDVTQQKKIEEALRGRVDKILRQHAVIVKLAKEEFSDLGSALEGITEADSKTINAERVSVWIFNEDHSEIVCLDLYEKSKNRHEKGATLSVKCYPRYFKALEKSRTIAANNARNDPHTCEFTKDYLSVFGITSMMDATIRLHGKTVGVVCHEHVGPIREWTLDEQNFVGSIADMVSLALESSERKKIEEALRESEERFRSIVKNSHNAILIVDDNFKIIYANDEALHLGGYSKQEIIGQDFRKYLDKESKSLILDRYLRRLKGEKVPSRYEFKIVRKNGEKRDVEIRSTIIQDRFGKKRVIAQLLDTTESKRMEGERKRFEERLSALNMYGQSLNMAKSMDEIYKLTLDAMEKTLGLEFADIFAIEGKTLCLVAHRGYSKDLSVRLPLDGKKGVTVKAAKSGKPILVSDVRKEKAYVKGGKGIRSEFAVPIKVEDKVLGVLNVESKKLAAFDENDRELLEILASHAAIAITNLKRQEKLSALNEYGQCLNMAKSMDEIYTLTLDAMERILGFEYASILTVEGKMLCLMANRGYSKALSLKLPLDGEKGITVRVVRTGKPVYVTDVTKDKAYVSGGIGIRSELAVPIKVGSRILGVLNVESNKLADFDEEYRKLLELLASHAAISISNLKRRDQFRNLSQRLEYLMKSSTDVMHIKEMHRRLRVIAKAIQSFGWRRVVMSLRDENLEGTDLVTAGLTKEEVKLLLERKAPGSVWKERLGKTFERFKSGEFYYLPWSDPWIRENVHRVPPGTAPDEATTYAGVPSKLSPEEMVDWHPQDMLYAPLRTPEGRIVGILSMDDPVDGRRPTRESLTPLELFLHQAAITIENAQLIESLREARKQLVVYAEQLEQKVEERTRELRKSQEQLLKAQRLAVIGELAGMVGHDLRNPLTSIAGAEYYLKKRLGAEADSRVKEMLELVEKNITYSNKIINDLLDYSKEIKLDLIEKNPKSLVKEALCLVDVPKNVQIRDLTENKPKIKVDVEKIKRAFVNIIKNAIEAMPKGGTLTIKSGKTNGNLEISFLDTGVGMSKETLAKLWTPLFTTKAKGMGFGLPICKRFSEAHGGSITVKSALRKGTIFTVILPIEQKIKDGGEKIWMKPLESSLLTTTKT